MDRDRTAVCKIISKMLDNPDKHGIYPTTVCYDELIKYVEQERVQAIGWMSVYCATHNEIDMADVREKMEEDLNIPLSESEFPLHIA